MARTKRQSVADGLRVCIEKVEAELARERATSIKRGERLKEVAKELEWAAAAVDTAWRFVSDYRDLCVQVVIATRGDIGDIRSPLTGEVLNGAVEVMKHLQWHAMLSPGNKRRADRARATAADLGGDIRGLRTPVLPVDPALIRKE